MSPYRCSADPNATGFVEGAGEGAGRSLPRPELKREGEGRGHFRLMAGESAPKFGDGTFPCFTPRQTPGDSSAVRDPDPLVVLARYSVSDCAACLAAELGHATPRGPAGG